MSPAEDDLEAEFSCSCSVAISPEWGLSLWQCAAGDDCPAWQRITRELEQCVRQLQIEARGLAPFAGESS